MASRQTQQVWKRFGAWYGADVLERKYGLSTPEDWAKAIDRIAPVALETVMADVRAKHPTWPPTLHEFEQLAKPKPAGASAVELLDAYVRKHYPTVANLEWIGNDGAIVGVRVPGIGNVYLRDVL